MTANIKIITDSNCGIPLHISRFPSGEVAVSLGVDEKNPFKVKKHVSVLVQGYEPDLLFILGNIKDALDKLIREADVQVDVRLFLGFMPHARYDRHMVDGDGFALRVFCDMLNLLKFSRIIVIDPHSDQTLSLLRNASALSQDEVAMLTLATENKPDYLVAPDAGAYKKIFKLSQKMGVPVVTLTKIRDLESGNIIETRLLDEIDNGAYCLIVDDLCDGGRTFIEAAKTLHKAGAERVDLFVTHGIFSAGLSNLLDNGITKLYCTDSFKTLDTEGWEGRIKQYNFF